VGVDDPYSHQEGIAVKVKFNHRAGLWCGQMEKGWWATPGAFLLAELAERVGLEAELSKALAPMAKRRRRHNPARVLVDLAITLADGGECISDLSVLRQQPELFGQVASTPTAGRVRDSIDERMLGRLAAAVARTRARVWRCGLRPQRVTLDFDATLVEVESENKEQAAPNYKHGFGYHPLLVYLDQTGEALGGMLRPGNAGSNTAKDHLGLLDLALAQLPTREEGLAVLVRSDSAGASHGFLDQIVSRGLEFSVGFDLTEPMREAVLKLSPQSWEAAITKDMEELEGAGDHRAARSLQMATGIPGGGEERGASSGSQLQPLRSQWPAPPGDDHQQPRSRHRLPGGAATAPRPGGGPGLRAGELPQPRFPGQPGMVVAGTTGPEPALLGPASVPRTRLPAGPAQAVALPAAALGGAAGSATGRRSIVRLDASWPWARELELAFQRLRYLPL
jgi:hypothetical protein